MLNIKNPKQGRYLNLDNAEYHRANAISNSGLLMVEKNPSDFKWSQTAPVDHSKSGAIDLGTAIHQAILEPEKLHDFLIAPVKGRDTIKFADFALSNPDKLVLTASEYDIVRFSTDSVLEHPTAKVFLDMQGDCETSIFYDDAENGVMRKIRPDKEAFNGDDILLIDVKKTKSISDWRSDKQWKNPLFELGYGHNAAYYMDTASKFYKRDIDSYYFLLIQSTIELGKYPVSVFEITRKELELYGFFDQMNYNLEVYSERVKSDNWFNVESFPQFEVYQNDDDIDFKFEGE